MPESVQARRDWPRRCAASFPELPMSRLLRLLPLAALFTLACKKEAPPEAPVSGEEQVSGLLNAEAGGTAAFAASVPAEVTVVLREAGAEPRQVLRYSAAPGLRQTMRMSMDMSMSMSMGGMALMDSVMPTMVMDMDVQVAEVSPEGNLRVQTELVAVDLVDREGVQAGMSDMLRGSLGGLVGMTTEGWMTSQGVTTQMNVNMPAGAPADAQDQAVSMQQNLSSGSLPMPLEAVGVGAVWEVRSRTASNGLVVDEVKLVTLESMFSDAVLLDIQLSQTLADPNMVPPGLPPGTQVSITRFESQGGGKSAVRLDRLVPDAGESQMTMEMEFDVNADGQTQTFDMGMSIAIGVKPLD